MHYELFVAWRYLRNAGRPSRAVWLSLLIGLAVFSLGLALFFLTGLKAVGAIIVVAGGIGVAAAALLVIFSTFTAISILGLAIGVAILIWVLSVTSGFQHEFRAKVLGVNAHILVLKYGIDFSDYRQVMKKSASLPGVIATAPFLFNEMMLAKGNRLSGVLVKGVDPRRSDKVLALPQHIIEPKPKGGQRPKLRDLLAEDRRHLPGIIIGRELAKKLDVKVGEPVRLISPLSGLDVSGWSADVDLPRSRDFRIVAVFDSGFDEYDKRLTYLHMREVQAFFDQGDVVTGVELKIRDVDSAPKMARRLSKLLGGSPYRTVDWSELNHNLFTALKIQKVFLEIVVGGFLAIVACFNVVAALAMLVIRKEREIAVLKAMGLSSWGISRVFQSCGVIVWIVGAAIGLTCGYFGALLLRRYGFPLNPEVYLISELPVRLNPAEFAGTAGVALVICLVATLYPAWRAARLQPVAGLHGSRR